MKLPKRRLIGGFDQTPTSRRGLKASSTDARCVAPTGNRPEPQPFRYAAGMDRCQRASGRGVHLRQDQRRIGGWVGEGRLRQNVGDTRRGGLVHVVVVVYSDTTAKHEIVPHG